MVRIQINKYKPVGTPNLLAIYFHHATLQNSGHDITIDTFRYIFFFINYYCIAKKITVCQIKFFDKPI